MKFKLNSNFKPTGDQPLAIEELVRGINEKKENQTLLGVTGSGKTFTIANVIEKVQKPTLVISHNKTLAAQLYQEFRDFFPDNAVSYFVSYYDYYQPEAYIPNTDTYIEKETQINDEIDKLRLSSTTNLLTRQDVIVIASVSCIYNLGSPLEYGRFILEIVEGQVVKRESILSRLTDLQYERSDYELRRGTFRLKGDTMQLWPAYTDNALKIRFIENQIEKIDLLDPLTGKVIAKEAPEQNKRYVIYPAKHYLTDPVSQQEAFKDIERDLASRLLELKTQGKIIEAYRLEQKVRYDLEMIQELGFVNGIENYSLYFDGRNPGDPPYTLLDYFHENARLFHKDSFLTIIDESHITIPQFRGMYFGDRSRKQTLIDYGFRLPSALDNRPLQFEEIMRRLPQNIFVSATPNEWEISQSGNEVIEQLIRPTGIVDPVIEIRKTEGQIDDLVREVIGRKIKGERVLITTLTKKMAEVLTDYLNDFEKISTIINEHTNLNDIPQIKVQYLHADVQTLERSEILDSLRRGEYDVVVGINLLREGLDLPEVSLVAILDADKEGFLRSRTSLIQTMGRAARHLEGKVIMYADTITGSMQKAIDEVKRRRIIQMKYNSEHGIIPKSIDKPIREQLIKRNKEELKKKALIKLSKKENFEFETFDPHSLTPKDKKALSAKLKRRMNQAAKDLDFELAAKLRDTISKII